MYYAAVVCPQEINSRIENFKNYMHERYGCTHALKSPAHITLIPPFYFDSNDELKLKEKLREVNKTLKPFEITLSGFGCFNQRVIYVDVMENASLNALYDAMTGFFADILTNTRHRENRNFHPHITIATRDIPPADFGKAYEYFTALGFAARFRTTQISLLKLIQGKWEVVYPLVETGT
ncbi:MAG: 2'-5' RNA ligase family protein [Chitinophagales bacterium]|nr:2'-5' RNA ligase family protein [Chitinophagales bacterium]